MNSITIILNLLIMVVIGTIFIFFIHILSFWLQPRNKKQSKKFSQIYSGGELLSPSYRRYYNNSFSLLIYFSIIDVLGILLLTSVSKLTSGELFLSTLTILFIIFFIMSIFLVLLSIKTNSLNENLKNKISTCKRIEIYPDNIENSNIDLEVNYR